MIYFGSSITPEQKEFYDGPNTSSNLQIDTLSDGEVVPIFRESVRRKDIYIVQSLCKDNVMETLSIVDAAKRAGARSINLVTPYLPYSRQDKKGKHRTSITAKLLADLLTETGVSSLITIDLHSQAIEGFYDIPIIHVDPKDIFIPKVREIIHMDPIVVAPDQGAVARATAVAKPLNLDMATIIKTRTKPNDMNRIDMFLQGDVKDRNVIIIDDIADTCGTLIKASELLLEKGAKSVSAMMTHGVLSGPSVGRINLGAKRPDGSLQDITVYVTDGMPSAIRASEFLDRIKIIPCHGLLYETIKKVAGLN